MMRSTIYCFLFLVCTISSYNSYLYHKSIRNCLLKNNYIHYAINNKENDQLQSTTTSSQNKSGGSGKKRILPQGEKRIKELINPNKLKIIGGIAKGKRIVSPDVYLRPMMSKVREALFSTLTHLGLFDSKTANVLDIFSGSGSVGLEALSRGANTCTFIDMSPVCTKQSLDNANYLGFPNVKAVTAKAQDVLLNPLKHGINQTFDLITLTPPYEEVIYQELIHALCNSPVVTADTIIVIEYPVEMGTLPYILGDDKLYGIRNRKYGRTVLGLYVYRPNKKYDSKPEEFLKL